MKSRPGQIGRNRSQFERRGDRSAVANSRDFEDIVAMKCIHLVLFAVAFAAPVLGQDTKPAVENPMTANWSKLGPAVEGSRGFTLSGRGIRLNASGQYELWVKIVPTDAAAFVRRYGLPRGTDYVLQYATVDCGKKLLLVEKTAAYDAAHGALAGRTSGITPSTRQGAVKPGSIGETLYKYVCEDPSLSPLNQKDQ